MIDPVLVGSVIRGLREKKGKTQEVVSGLAGLDRTHYSKIERGCAALPWTPCFALPKPWT